MLLAHSNSLFEHTHTNHKKRLSVIFIHSLFSSSSFYLDFNYLTTCSVFFRLTFTIANDMQKINDRFCTYWNGTKQSKCNSNETGKNEFKLFVLLYYCVGALCEWNTRGCTLQWPRDIFLTLISTEHWHQSATITMTLTFHSGCCCCWLCFTNVSNFHLDGAKMPHSIQFGSVLISHLSKLHHNLRTTSKSMAAYGVFW